LSSENLNPSAAVSSDQVSYVERFEQERNEWTEEVKKISSRFKNVEDMVEVQVDLYSKRQQAVEYMHQLMVLQSRLKKNWIAEYKKAYEALLIDADYRYSEKEKQRIAEEKTSTSKLKLEILQSHVDFFKETTKTIDNMIFGVKHRLEIEDFRRGNK
jgi:hypothetical protein